MTVITDPYLKELYEEATCPLDKVPYEAHQQTDRPRGMTPCELRKAIPINGVDIPHLKSVVAEHHRTYLQIAKIFTHGLSIQDYPNYHFIVPLYMLVRTICRYHELVTKVRVTHSSLYVDFGEYLYAQADID